MKRKIRRLLILCSLSITLAFCLSGCSFGEFKEKSRSSFDQTIEFFENSWDKFNDKVFGKHTVDGSGFCSACDKAINPTKGVTYELSEDKTFAVVKKYEGDYERVNIASHYENLPVKKIGPSVFSGAKFKQIILPETVSEIGYRSFIHCEQLKSVVTKGVIEKIEELAFENCKKLTQIDFKNGLKSIGRSAFQNCENLQSAILPDSVTELGLYAFYRCDKLTTVRLSNQLKTIETSAFSNCAITEIEIPDSVEEINSCAFFSNPIEELVIPDSVIFIGDNAFNFCTSLKTLVLGNNVKTIAYLAFSATAVEKVIIPLSVETIGNMAIDAEKIYCRAQSAPIGWDEIWCSTSNPVEWGYTGD